MQDLHRTWKVRFHLEGCAMSKWNHLCFQKYMSAFSKDMFTHVSHVFVLNTSSVSPEKYCTPWKRPLEIHITGLKNRLFCYISAIVIYLDFQLAKRALWLGDPWSRAPYLIQMYPDWDTIAQLLPTHQIQQHVISAWQHEKWRDLQHALTSAWLLNFASHSQEARRL